MICVCVRLIWMCVYVHKENNILFISFQIILNEWVRTCFPLFTLMEACKFGAPLSLSVFLVLFHHTGPFLEKRLESKSFWTPLLERGVACERGEKRQDCSLLELFYFYEFRTFFNLLPLLNDSNQLNITQRLSLYWKSMKKIYAGL